MKLFYLLLLGIVFYSCNPDLREITCSTIRDCDIGDECKNGICIDGNITMGCKKDEDCVAGKICNKLTYRCEEVFVCDSTQACYDHDSRWNKENNPVICKTGVCVEDICKTSTTCKAGSICANGRCVTVPDCSHINKVKIVSSSVVLREGITKKLTAVAYNKNNVPKVVPLSNFTWNSSDSTIVSVNGDGIVKGESISGNANITATYGAGCNVKSEDFKVENFADLAENTLRVILRDLDTGRAISGTTLNINGENKTTNDDGFVEVTSVPEKNTITVTDSRYEYITIQDIETKDIIIHLIKHKPFHSAGGYHGKFDFSKLGIDQVKIGISGSSLPDSILDLSFDFLIGETKLTHISIANIEGDYPIPTSMIIELGNNKIRDEYQTVGIEGNRAFWGLGGREEMSNLMTILSSAMGEDSSMIDLLKGIVPLFKDFKHAIELNQTVTLCPKIQDETDRSKLVPDFNNVNCFPKKDLILEKSLSFKTKVKIPKLPTIDGVMSDMGLIMIGYDVPANGFVPVGIMMGTDKNEDTDTPDGLIDDQDIFYAPQYKGAEGSNGTVVVFSLSSADYSSGDEEEEKEVKVKLSGIVKNYENGNIPNEIDLKKSSFMETGAPTISNHVITINNISGSDFHRIKIRRAKTETKEGRIWMIYSKSNTITLPTINSFDNPESILIQNVDLGDNLSMDTLFEFNTTSLEEFTKVIERFSVYELDLTTKK